MNNFPKTLRIGTRGSSLALWQADWVTERLHELCPDMAIEREIIKTTGDKVLDVPLAKIGDKGLFTKELDRVLLDKRVDLVVHSLKDVPTEPVEGIITAAIPEREDPRDVFIGKGDTRLENLPPRAMVGTGSLRRRAQLLALRPDIQWQDLRGNVDTRVRKLFEGDLDGIILAFAGVKRLGIFQKVTHTLDAPKWLPAPGQGALAIQVRADDTGALAAAELLDDKATRAAVTAERAVLARLEGGCHVPMGAYARVENQKLALDAFIGDLAGIRMIRRQEHGAVDEAAAIGDRAGIWLLEQGGSAILAELAVELGHA